MKKFKADGQLGRLWQASAGLTLEPKAAAVNIDMYGPIGDMFFDGVSVGDVKRALRDADGDDVVVNINSPGGSMFDGLEIYRLLREYPGNVTTRVGALAASAASIVAMAGDVREIADVGTLMIHRCWTFAEGNAEAFEKMATDMRGFDNTLAGVYAVVTGADSRDIMTLMAAETYINAEDAIAQGFATGYTESKVKRGSSENVAAYRADSTVDKALADAGFTRAQRRELIKSLKSTSAVSEDGAGTQIATGTDTPSAVAIDMSETAALAASLKNLLS